jgi:hypothetical protein
MQQSRLDLIARWGLGSSAATALLAAVSFGIAATTPPRTGPFAAPSALIAYPFDRVARFVPRDFIWLYPTILMMATFLVLVICVAHSATGERRFLGTIAQSLASISFAVIAADYFVQLQTVQPALLQAGEAASMVTLSQYNPHGVFIALENLGYLTMALSFAFLGLTLGTSKLERATRRVLLIGSALTVLAFVGMWSYFGLGLEYRFEVTAIMFDWLTLVVSGVMLALVFRRSTRGAIADSAV